MTTNQPTTINSRQLSTEMKNKVLAHMANLLEENRESIKSKNKQEVDAYTGNDQSLSLAQYIINGQYEA